MIVIGRIRIAARDAPSAICRFLTDPEEKIKVSGKSSAKRDQCMTFAPQIAQLV